jgi:ribosomal protein S18 acetylase RimI-like enzyme
MNFIKGIRFQLFNIPPSDTGKPIVTRNGTKYWLCMDEFPPHTIGAFRKGKNCGFIRVLWFDDHLELGQLTVLKKYRRKGLGTALLQWLITYCRNEKIPKIWAIIQPENEVDFDWLMEWYLRQGFVRESQESKVIVFNLNQTINL